MENRLTVLSETKKDNRPYYLCKCSCGNEKLVLKYHFLSDKIRSCGCLRKELLVKQSTTHKQSKTRLYSIWQGMRSRCNNPNVDCYHHYGGRGIKICDEWNAFEGFRNTIPPGYREYLELDRRDVDGEYSPENCRWVTRGKNCANKSSKSDGTINGVSYNKRDDLWKASVSVNGKRLCKYFKNKEDATKQRLAWNIEYDI